MTVMDTATLVEDLAAVRERTLDLVSHLPRADLERQITPIMSPLAWDLGHIAAYEDLWLVHRHAGLDLLRPDLAALYDAFETPRAVRGDLEILGYDDAVAYLAEVRDRTLAALETTGPDPVIHEMVLQHELQHTETMRQAMALAGLLPPGEPRLPALSGPEEWLRVPAGTHALGAPAHRFSYDNERPLHAVHVDGFAIARRPVTNATWLRFVEGGGYVRREWWSQEGWAWKEEYDITHHASGDVGTQQLHPDAPACHLSFFEAEALARWCGARLPTEAEWEKAAGRLDGVGLVWEWTTSPFGGYPGFEAHPYREYSEVFFGTKYHVLRGGSWATHPRVATTTFRNWDLPERRQIFAGVRLARDLGEAS
jgi:iron(II)-dependent oxidoreductase